MTETVFPALARLWADAYTDATQRLAVLDAYVVGAIEREAAIDAAHKLAGTLGTFGLDTGTEHARAIEHALHFDAPWADQRIALHDILADAAPHAD